MSPDELHRWFEDYQEACTGHDLERVTRLLSSAVRRPGDRPPCGCRPARLLRVVGGRIVESAGADDAAALIARLREPGGSGEAEDLQQPARTR